MKKSVLMFVWLSLLFVSVCNAQQIHKSINKSGHKVLTIAFNENSRMMASAGKDNEIALWDTETGDLLNILKGHIGWITSLNFSPDGRFLVSGSKDKTAIIWNLTGGVLSKTLRGHTDYVTSVCFSPDSRYVVTGSYDHSLKVWDINTENSLRTLSGHEAKVEGVSFSPEGKTVASVSEDKTLRIWDVNKGITLKNIKAHNAYIRAVSYSPDGKYIATAGDDKKIKLWESQSLSEVKTLTGHKNWVQSLNFSSDSKYIVAGDHDFKVKVWDIAGGSEKMNIKQNSFVTSVAFSPNGKFLAAADLGDVVNIWEVSTLGIVPPANALIADNTKDKKDTKLSNDLDFDVAKQPENFLLIVGISRYEHWSPLNNAIKDAQDVKNVLLDRYNFKKENLEEVYDKEATEEGIFKALQKIKQKITGNDNLLIYYSGHGYYDPDYKEGYWVPVDARQKKTTEYFPNSTLLKYLGAIDTKHTFLVADACFSGALFSDANRGYIENVEQIKSRWGLSSGNIEFVSDGVAGENSPFANYFIKYLKDNQKPKFPVSDLIQYVKVAVANNTNQTPLGNPLKGIGHEGGEFVFYLKK